MVIAESFARIFFRNAINIGLPIIELNDVSGLVDKDLLEVDLSEGTVKNLTKKNTYNTQSFPVFLQEFISQGGLINWIKVKEGRCKNVS